MKTLVMILFFLFGLTVAGNAQTSTENKAEKKTPARSEKKQYWTRKQTYHFDQPVADKNIKHNGTDAYKKMHQSAYVVDGDGFGSTSSSSGKRKHFFKKKRKQGCSAVTMR